MKKIHLEIFLGLVFVLGGTYVAYNALAPIATFWSAQNFWSGVLILCWCVVSMGYWHQGMMVHKAKSASHVSLGLSLAVFTVQCILFIKGIYYEDVSLIVGAVLVNSGVVFNIYQILKYHPFNKKII